MKHTQLHLAVASLVCLGQFSAMAAEPAEGGYVAPLPPSSSAVSNSANLLTGNVFESSGIPVGKVRSKNALKLADGINIFADVETRAGYDTNVTQASKGSEIGSSFYNVRPTVVAETLYRADSYRLAYKGDYNHYPNFDADSVGNNDLLFAAQNVFGTRSSVAWGASYIDRFDPVGSTDRSINATEADHYRGMAINATFGYGATDATGRVEVDAGLASKRYLNNRETTESADVDNTNLGARFYYRVAPKTRLLAEYRWTTFDYAHDSNYLENTETRYLLGAVWDASSALSGSVKAGSQHKDYFYDKLRPAYTGFTWEAGLRWTPLTYSSFDLIGGRAATDPSGSLDVPITKSASLAWNHDWSSYVHSKLSAGKKNTRYGGAGRRDIENAYSVGFMYDVRRWLGLGVEYNFTHRDSTSNEYDYIRRMTVLKADASF